MIIGFDLASRRSGWCAGGGDEVPTAGAYLFEQYGDDLGRIGHALREAVKATFQKYAPTAVVYEAPILVVKRGPQGYTDNLLKIRKLYGLGMILEEFCVASGVPCYEASVADLKIELTGDRRAEKDAMVAVARKCGVALPEGEAAKDAADAFAAWLLGVRKFNRPASSRWDHLIWSRRPGALL